MDACVFSHAIKKACIAVSFDEVLLFLNKLSAKTLRKYDEGHLSHFYLMIYGRAEF